MDQIKQIDQNQDNNINTQELLDAIKPNGFLSNENNLEEVGKLLNNEELNDGDKELLNSLTNTIDEEINRIIESGKVTEEDINLINVWKKLLGENYERVQKLEELVSQENNEGINNEDEINTTSENIIQQKYNNLSDTEIGELATKINIGADLINDIDTFLNNSNTNFLNENIIKGTNILNKIIKEDPERHEKLEKKIKEKVLNMSKNVNIRIGNNDHGNIDYYRNNEKMLIQLRANVCYGEDLVIDGKRGANIRNVNETNEGKTNIYIYQLELKTRKDVREIRTQFSSLLNIPNLDAKFNGISPEAKDSIMREFLQFFLKIRVHGMAFENKIGTIDLEKVLTQLINAEKFKYITIKDYYERFEKQVVTEEEKAEFNKEKERLQKLQEEGYQTMGEVFRDSATELMEQLLEKDKQNVEYNKELAEINELNQTFKEFQDLYKDNEIDENERKEKLGQLGKKLLDNPRLDENTRKELILLIGSEFSEIETNFNRIDIQELARTSLLGKNKITEGEILPTRNYTGPETILCTPGCKIEIGLKDMTDIYMYNNGPKPQTLCIYLDGEYLFDGEPKPNGLPQKFYREGYDIYIDENNSLVIKKKGDGSELMNTFGNEIYENYQTTQQEINTKQEKYEEYSEILAQLESEDQLNILEITEESKKIINDETGYTKKLENHYAALKGMTKANTQYASYDIPAPQPPEYSEYHELKIPGCEGKIVHINPSELGKILGAIQKYGKNICFIPSNKSNNIIYELTIDDLKISEKDNDGNIHIFEINNDGNKGNEIKSITSEEIKDVTDVNNIIMSTIQKSPGLMDAMECSMNLESDIKSMQELYKKFDRSNEESLNTNGKRGLTDDDIKELRLKASETATNLKKLCDRHNDFVQLKKGLEERFSGKSNITTEHEKAIKGFITNLDFLIDASTEGGDLSKFCNDMLNSNNAHSNDKRYERLGRRLKNNTLKVLGAIAGGVAAVILAVPSGGCSLLAMAAIMTAGGMAGGFLGHMVHQGLRTLYYNHFGEVEINGQKIQLRYDDPTSLKLAIDGKISRGEYGGELVLQFLMGTATTFGCMAAGQIVGGRISKACETGKHPKLDGFLNKFNKNFKVENGDPATDGIFKSLVNKVGKNTQPTVDKFNKAFFYEFKDELREEIGETGFDELSNSYKGNNAGLSMLFNGLAFFATARHCITPGGNMSRIYRENGISIGDANYNNATNAIEITLDYSGNYDAIIEYYRKNKFELKDGHLEMPNPENPAIKNIIYLHKTEVSYEARGLASQLSGFGISIDTETGKGYYQKMSDIMALELSGAANVEIDPRTKKVRVISGEITLELEQDYFGGKSHKFDISTSQALANSKMMDNLTKAFDENNPSSDIIQQAREEIQKQIKEATGKDIQLTDEQIISIFKSHNKPGLIGNLGINELSAKDHILAETIEDADIRRFLLESGFCAKSELDLRDPLSIVQKNQIEYRIKGGENSELTENPEITKAKNAMIEAIEQVKKDITKVEQELEQAKQEGNKEKIEKIEKKLQTLKNKETVMTAILEKIENARLGLNQLLEGQLKDGTVETIEKFLEQYQLGLNEGKTTIVDKNGKETDLKWKKIDETSRMLALKYYYEAIMKPLGLTIFADPSLTMGNVNENFVDEVHSEGFEIKESDKLTTERGKEAGKIGDNILEQIAINEGRITKGEKTGDIKSMVNEEIEKLKDNGKETTESKIATELWASIQKHSEGKISDEDQAYLFAFSMKEMADYMTAYPNMTAEQVFTLLNSNQNKLIHQHLRDLNTVTSSDHGIKHVIRGNITLAENIFLQLENEGYWDKLYENNKKEGETKEQFKARWKVLTRQAVIDHDLGYTHVANKAFDEEGFGKGFHMVSDHPLRSTTWIDNNQTFYTILFGEDGYNSLMESVPGHGNAQTQNISKIADGTATQTEFIRGILSCVDCAGSPGDYKIAHMFAQKEMIGGLFNAYSLLDRNNIEGAKQALTNLIETIEAMPDSGELGLIKKSRKKGIDAFLTNKDFNNMSPDELKDTFKFHFNKFLGAFGVVTEIDPNTGRVKAGINKNGGFSIEFALAGESFEILAERLGAGVALKSLIGVCDDYKINDKGPTSKFLEWQTQQAINKRNSESKIKPLKEYITDYFNHTPTESEIGQFNDYLKKKAGNKRKESDIVSFKDGIFYTGTRADDASIDFSPNRGIIMKGPNNVEISLNFDGKSYEGFNETAGRFLEMNEKIDGHIIAIENAKDNPDLLKERAQAIIVDLQKYGDIVSKEKPWIDIKGWDTVTKAIADIADEPVINYDELINKINEIRATYEIKMQQVQSSNPTLNN